MPKEKECLAYKLNSKENALLIHYAYSRGAAIPPRERRREMKIFKENKETGLQCGVNDYGEVFLDDNRSGYNLPDTPENRERVIADFDYYNK